MSQENNLEKIKGIHDDLQMVADRAKELDLKEIAKFTNIPVENVEIVITALEKDIPKKVEIKPWNPCVCPTCGEELSTFEGDGYYKHPTFLERCPNPDCAQKLKWED